MTFPVMRSKRPEWNGHTTSVFSISPSLSGLVSRNNFASRKTRYMVKLNERKIRWIIHEKLRGRGTGELALIQRVSRRRDRNRKQPLENTEAIQTTQDAK